MQSANNIDDRIELVVGDLQPMVESIREPATDTFSGNRVNMGERFEQELAIKLGQSIEFLGVE